MKLVMIASGYFPIQDVSSLRIHSYCKALAKSGISVEVLIVYPVSLGSNNTCGNFEGVDYRYVTSNKYNRSGWFGKLYYRMVGLVEIAQTIKRDKVQVVLSYHDNLLSNVFISIISKIFSIPYLIDKTEYPYGYFKMSKFKQILTGFNLKLFDGFIVITKELESFYSKFSKNIFLLPMTIDPDRFGTVVINKPLKPYVALTFGTHNRDGLFESVKSYHYYRKIADLEPFDLYVIGDYEELCRKNKECINILNYIIENRLENHIFIKGKLPIDKVPTILANASCLLTTPSKYSSGGFPTKLGEYMLSGTPVVATIAGEITDYVSNGVDILLSDVADLYSVARNIKVVQENQEKAEDIATNAIRTARKKFNAETYVGDLIAFLLLLRELRKKY